MQSIISPEFARRHFIRVYDTHFTDISNGNFNTNIFDTLKLNNGNKYNINFLINEYWDKITENINSIINIEILITKFRIEESKATELFNIITNKNEINDEEFSEFLLSKFSKIQLIELFSILYASSRRRRNIRKKRRSSSLIKETKINIKPVAIAIPKELEKEIHNKIPRKKSFTEKMCSSICGCCNDII
jgi:hypothetical protein